MLLAAAPARPQQVDDQFGVQFRAQAAQQMIVLAVQQGISSLPPTSGQTFTYEFDPELSAFVPSSRMGPTSFRAPQVIGAGRFSLRGAASYFAPAETFGPIDYQLVGREFPDPPGICTRFGLDVSAQVGLFNLAATYGVTDRIEVNLNLPIVVTNVSGEEIFYALNRDPFDPSTAQPAAASCDNLGSLIAGGTLREVKRPFQDVTLPGGSLDFSHGTNAGVGRISVGTKVVLHEGERFQLAFAPEFFFPSPSMDEYAGSDTGAVLPRLIAQVVAMPAWRFHIDAGYDYDYELAELRRFTWNTGTSYASEGEYAFTVDAGVGGSQFDEGIQWTPEVATFTTPRGTGQIQAFGDTRLGTTFVDFLGGIKVRLSDQVSVSGAVNVPLNSQGFRADAVGTLAAEYYF